MSTNRCKRRKSSGGFTLLDMLIVVAIIAVLAAIALSIFSGAMEKAKKETCAANRRSLKATLTAAYMTGGEDAVAAEYEKEGADFTCPSGGKLTYTLDTATGVVTVRCSLDKHQGDEGGTDSADAKLAVSLPLPPSRVSFPKPPSRVSLPAPPLRLSLPLPPLRRL